MKTAVACCMRNEGPFILEWVAYHLSIGFDKVFVATNDCTDGTHELLEELKSHVNIFHIPQALSPDQRPQVEGMRRILTHPEMKDVDWVLHIDADEFLAVSAGKRRVVDLLEQFEHADNIALLWRVFGDSGQEYWRGGSVLRQFTRSQRDIIPFIAMHKSFFRPDRFGRAIDHMPKDPVDDTVVSINSRGDALGLRAHKHPDWARYKMGKGRLTWDNAAVYHYVIRSQDVFLMKNDRGDGMGWTSKKYTINSDFFRRYNRNEVLNDRMRAHMADVDELMREWLENEKLRRMDASTLTAFFERRDAYLTAERRKSLVTER